MVAMGVAGIIAPFQDALLRVGFPGLKPWAVIFWPFRPAETSAEYAPALSEIANFLIRCEVSD